jgi:hypothetical protein
VPDNDRKKGLAGRILQIGDECAKHLKGHDGSMDPDDLFYDEETGLPK